MDGSDEKLSICNSITEMKCHRAFKHEQALPIPIAWVQDEAEDCLDGTDERDFWQTCGFGPTKRFMGSVNEPCNEVFLCGEDVHVGEIVFIELKDLCKGIDLCIHEEKVMDDFWA